MSWAARAQVDMRMERVYVLMELCQASNHHPLTILSPSVPNVPNYPQPHPTLRTTQSAFVSSPTTTRPPTSRSSPHSTTPIPTRPHPFRPQLSCVYRAASSSIE